MKRDLVSAVVLVFAIFAGAAGRATPRRGPLSLVARFAVRAPLLGRSQQGRPIVAWRVGDPRGTRVLVVGCIHGNEYAGIAVVRALERARTRFDLWLVPNLILRIEPQLTIWFHQHMNLVWASGPSSAAGRIYVRAAVMRFYHHHWLPSAATNWQNHHMPGSASFTVELPACSLSRQQVRQQVHAMLTLAAALHGAAHL